MPGNQKGICVPLIDCDFLNALISKKMMTKADRVFLRRSRCGHINTSPFVCCPKSETVQSRFDGAPLEIDDLPSDCGQLHQNHEFRIVGGTEARIFDSPWLALLQYKKRKYPVIIILFHSFLCRIYLFTFFSQFS